MLLSPRNETHISLTISTVVCAGAVARMCRYLRMHMHMPVVHTWDRERLLFIFLLCLLYVSLGSHNTGHEDKLFSRMTPCSLVDN